MHRSRVNMLGEKNLSFPKERKNPKYHHFKNQILFCKKLTQHRNSSFITDHLHCVGGEKKDSMKAWKDLNLAGKKTRILILDSLRIGLGNLGRIEWSFWPRATYLPLDWNLNSWHNNPVFLLFGPNPTCRSLPLLCSLYNSCSQPTLSMYFLHCVLGDVPLTRDFLLLKCLLYNCVPHFRVIVEDVVLALSQYGILNPTLV